MAKTKAASQPQKGKLTLNTLKPASGSTHPTKRVGRGRASGVGKTSGRGHNGEGQRAGRSQKRAFEGGQMPLFRRLPHIKGFELVNRKHWVEINVGDLAKLTQNGSQPLTYDLMKALGRFNPLRFEGVRILGNGELTCKVSVEVHHVSASAKQKIEAAGGQITLIGSQSA